MEFLILILLFALLLIYVVFRECMNVDYRKWLAELDIFKRLLEHSKQLKISVCDQCNLSVHRHISSDLLCLATGALCTGEKGEGKSGKKLAYEGSGFHRVIKG